MQNNNRILDLIKRPHDISVLNNEELEILCQEIRDQIIETTSKNGGHVAASLGAVELIVATHSIINVPEDKLIFDVGHQSYAHMLLCGNADKFGSLRKYGGFSGFPRPGVSEFDSSVSGHASDSLSVAAGYAHANMLNNSKNKVVALIGDASIEGGLALEALGYIGANQLPVVILLNDNGMSISKPVGAITRHLSQVRAAKSYRKSQKAMLLRLQASGYVGKFAAESITRTKASLKQILWPHSILFEEMGIMCTPPIDGNNVAEVREMLDLALQVDGPVLVHTITKKGKGYRFAEQDPEKFHGIGAYDIKSGEVIAKKKPYWTDVFGKALLEEAKKNEKIVAMTAAMEGGVGLKEFHKIFPNRYIDVGVAEENAVAMAEGLCYAGKIPVVCIYSSFLQRAFDQIVMGVAIENNHIIFAIDRAGLVGADGATHHGMLDIAYLRTVPNLTIMCPSSDVELKNCLHTAINMTGPVAIRYPRGEAIVDNQKRSWLDNSPKTIEVGKSRVLKKGDDVAILAFGNMVQNAILAADILHESGIEATVVDMRFAKPIDENILKKIAKFKVISSIEDGILQGGAGEAAFSFIANNYKKHGKFINFAIDNRFVTHGRIDELQKEVGQDPKSIASKIKKAYIK